MSINSLAAKKGRVIAAAAPVISFPHMGSYAVAVEFLLKRVFPRAKIVPPPPITKATLEKGAKHSPDFVCSPFKYNLGNFIEALDGGANLLIQAGGGCRFGFYGELQEQILRDLGYEFRFINLFGADGVKVFEVLKACRQIDPRINLFNLAYSVLLTVKMVKIMDEMDIYIRKNIGFEKNENDFEGVQKQFFAQLGAVKNFVQLNKIAKDYRKKFREIELEKPPNPMRVALIGELYNLMEPFANYFMEKELAKNHVEISRFINATYLLFQKNKLQDKTVAAAGKYLKYHLGADGTDSVAHAKALAESGFDGIIHVKPFGCTPEVNAMPMLMNIGKDYKIPIIYFSFDAQTSEEGIKTRLEAFYDMLIMKSAKNPPSVICE